MAGKPKLALVAVLLGGLFVGPVANGAAAAVPVDPLALTAEDTQKFKALIDPATWSQEALVAWLDEFREAHPDPGDIGELSLDLALLVEDDNPNKDTILALIQDMLATAAGPPYFVPTNGLDLVEYPCTANSSPICAF